MATSWPCRRGPVPARGRLPRSFLIFDMTWPRARKGFEGLCCGGAATQQIVCPVSRPGSHPVACLVGALQALGVLACLVLLGLECADPRARHRDKSVDTNAPDPCQS